MADFTIRGKIDPREGDFRTEEGQLQALALDRNGQVVGKADVARDGSFEIEPRLREPTRVRVVVAPAQAEEEQRLSSPVMLELSEDAWKKRQDKFTAEATLAVDQDNLTFLVGRTICISGHVRKIVQQEEGTNLCPVPFVKVEVFDVDREACWWPPILEKLPDLLDRPVVKIPDLISPRPLPEPIPLPDPIPEPFPLPRPRPQPDPAPFREVDRLESVLERNRPRLAEAGRIAEARLSDETVTRLRRPVSFEPQPIGEVAQLDPEIIARLYKLTLTSTQPPWVLRPHCFYSKRVICTTTTNEQGYFNCCFKWWPIHFRRGRLRFDWRPDVILRVTQVIDGVEQVIYLDPYTSTRWNVDHAHIDLCLDDERIECGTPDDQERPAGTQAFFTRIGTSDEVYKIHQTTGLYTHGGITNAAYGGALAIHGQFGATLSSGDHYYRLSWAPKSGGSFTPISAPLRDVRVHRVSDLSESHTLGPHTVNGQAALYEIRDFDDYLWYHADLIGSWGTGFESDEGTYRLRLEVFDQNGQKLGQTDVDYKDGTHPPNGILPSTGQDWADLVVHIDNVLPEVDFDVPAVEDDSCGVIRNLAQPVQLTNVNISQANGRLRTYSVTRRQGLTGGSVTLASGSGSNGSPTPAPPASITVLTTAYMASLPGTCAFTVEAAAYPHVRDGSHWRAVRVAKEVSIAVEKCS